jgi:hypothetical protein
MAVKHGFCCTDLETSRYCSVTLCGRKNYTKLQANWMRNMAVASKKIHIYP